MRTTSGFALRQVRDAFQHLVGQMQTMHSACQVKPNDVNVIQSISNRADVTLQCKPVVCRVPERANHGIANLYVVLSGSISFESELTDKHLMTLKYETNFGYFRISNDKAAHVLGGHYDFSPAQAGHPHAHLQLRSQADMYLEAKANFSLIADVPLANDPMMSVLDRVRPPTAQMDFLSFMLQVCADHLVWERSTAQTVSTFERLTASCSPILGYHARVVDDCDCHRASHWYESI